MQCELVETFPASPRNARAQRSNRRREARVRERYAADVYRQLDNADGEEKVRMERANMKAHPFGIVLGERSRSPWLSRSLG